MSIAAGSPVDERSRHRVFEQRVLGQLRARATALTHGRFPADSFEETPTTEGIDSVRDQLSRLGVYDRGAAESVGGTQSVEIRFRKKLIGGVFTTDVSRVRVRTITPVEALLHDRSAGPAGREDVLDALAQYEVLPRRERPSGVVLASATGFTPEAKALIERNTPPTLILIGGREDGGWDITLPKVLQKTPWAKWFELETQDERVQRVLYHLSKESEALETRGISVVELAEKLGLPRADVERLVHSACRTDGRLMTVVQNGVVHVCRTPFADQKGTTMGWWSRVRRLLRLKPSAAEHVREMTGQRVKLESERHELEQRVEALEQRERDYLSQGAAAPSDAEKKQVARKLVQLRRDLNMVRSQSQVLAQQIDIIGTQIHNLTLAEKGRRAELPKAEDLTATAAQAEQVVAELSANAELARGIAVNTTTPMMEEEEDAIFAEFKQVAEAKSQAGTPSAAVAESSSGAAKASTPASPASPSRTQVPPVPTQAATPKRDAARPEMG